MWNPFSDSAKGAVEGLGSAVAKAVGAFKADPTKLLEFETAIQQATIKFQADAIAAVNATMQEEAKSEHWMQWAWRPTFGFTACAILVNNYILLPYLAKAGVVPIAVPSEVWLMIMAVLGVAAWTRGRDKDAK
jgi:roadblock/LC7 domain-containing protein